MSSINPEPIKNYLIGDREYCLHTFHCADCGDSGYCICRIAGIHPSFFILPCDFDPDHFECICDGFDEDLFVTAPKLFADFYKDLSEINNTAGIHIDLTFSSRLLEYGRIRTIRLKRLDALDALLATEMPLPPFSAAVQAAFEFGFAAGQYATNKHSEELFWEGIFARRAREQGQARARTALLKKGQKTRQVVARAAQTVYAANPALMRNDSAAARAVQRLDWPDLRPNGKMLSQDSITKRLREERKRSCSKNLHENPNLGKSSR